MVLPKYPGVRWTRWILASWCLLWLASGCAAESPASESPLSSLPTPEPSLVPTSGPYLDQPAPGPLPQMFAPGIVSMEDQSEYAITFSPDGTEIYYTGGPAGGIMVIRLVNGQWAEPEITSLSVAYDSWGPFVSPDGSKLYFVSNRPPASAPDRQDANIWVASRVEGGWSEPEYVPAPINTPFHEDTPFVASDGTLYFVSDRPEGLGLSDVYASPLTQDGYTKVENLGEPVNSPYVDEGPVLTQDNRVMLLASNRPGTIGEADLFSSILGADGAWQEPENLGEAINTFGPEYAPRLSLDDRFLFFSAQGDIYWVDANVLDLGE